MSGLSRSYSELLTAMGDIPRRAFALATVESRSPRIAAGG
jgi:hypothetical protein